mgnify:CR=1 FL=1
MKRLLIVDDEQPMVLGLSLLIKRHFSQEYVIVGTASSGREAVERDAQLNPDILLMDVQMPGISGLEAIKTIARKGNPKAFILVTAYERFDIAREALSLGVCDYLLKPVSRDRLELALKVASDYLDRLNLLAQRELELRESIQKLTPSLVRALFDFLEHGEGSHECSLIAGTLGLQASHGVMGIAAFVPADGDVSSMYRRFSDIVHYKSEAVAGPLRDGRWCSLLVPLSSEHDPKAAAIQTLLEHAMPSPGKVEWSLHLGGPVPLEELARSFKEAFQHFVGQTGGNAPSERNSAEEIQHQNAGPLLAGFSAIIEEIRKYRFHAASRSFAAWIESWSAAAAGSLHLLHSAEAVLAMLASVLYSAGAISISRYESAMDFEDLRGLWAAGTGEAFAARCLERFDDLLKAVQHAKPYSNTVRAALQYIEDHYAEQISLENAADTIGVSPARLSRLMTEETGKGFARTLIEYRMQRAKELLRTTGWPVRRVSEACGYPDANYFSRLFRKIEGMSPREYAERAEEDDNG